MKKKLSILAFSLCLLTFGVLLTACSTPEPTIAFVENASLTREYDGTALSQEDILLLVENKDQSDASVKFYQNETEITAPTDAGTYKIVVSNEKDSIEENFVITPKALKNVATVTSVWSNGTGQRSFLISNPAKIAGGVLVGDDVSITVKTESYELNAPVSEVVMTGEDSNNYTLANDDVVVLMSLKVIIASSIDPETTLAVYLKYGDNNIYTNLLCTTTLTADKLTETFGDVTQITNGFNSSVINLDTMKLTALAQYSEGNFATDTEGRLILTNGKNADSITFTAQIAE